jgi:hypothetical protein
MPLEEEEKQLDNQLSISPPHPWEIAEQEEHYEEIVADDSPHTNEFRKSECSHYGDSEFSF